MKFMKFSGEQGALTAIEGTRDIPFEVKRIYYITNVPENARRGFHSHKRLHQVLLCLNGSVTIQVQNGKIVEEFVLDNPSEGLYIGPNVWREMYNFSPSAVLMVLASEYYDENDYTRDYETYLADVSKIF